MHEISSLTPPASDFSFLMSLKPRLFDKAKLLDAYLTPLANRSAENGCFSRVSRQCQMKDTLLPAILANSAC